MISHDCILCGSPAVAVFHMDEGCACSDATEQPLCMQHIVKATPRGSMELAGDLTVNQEFTKWWHARKA